VNATLFDFGTDTRSPESPRAGCQPGTVGVYWLTDANGHPLYIGSSKNIAARVDNHRRRALTDPEWTYYSVRIHTTSTLHAARGLERLQIHAYRPPRNKYGTGQ
jgi:excinuclease UvrABC nuclease subunit